MKAYVGYFCLRMLEMWFSTARSVSVTRSTAFVFVEREEVGLWEEEKRMMAAEEWARETRVCRMAGRSTEVGMVENSPGMRRKSCSRAGAREEGDCEMIVGVWEEKSL